MSRPPNRRKFRRRGAPLDALDLRPLGLETPPARLLETLATPPPGVDVDRWRDVWAELAAMVEKKGTSDEK